MNVKLKHSLVPELGRFKAGTATVTSSVGVNHGLPPAPHKTWKRGAKYRNSPTRVDGIKFASKKEARRYGELKVLEKEKHIEHLTLQRTFKLEVNGHLICAYRADFDYFDLRAGVYVVEDTKGFRTPEYILKRKLMLACHGIAIRES